MLHCEHMILNLEYIELAFIKINSNYFWDVSEIFNSYKIDYPNTSKRIIYSLIYCLIY